MMSRKNKQNFQVYVDPENQSHRNSDELGPETDAEMERRVLDQMHKKRTSKRVPMMKDRFGRWVERVTEGINAMALHLSDNERSNRPNTGGACGGRQTSKRPVVPQPGSQQKNQQRRNPLQPIGNAKDKEISPDTSPKEYTSTANKDAPVRRPDQAKDGTARKHLTFGESKIDSPHELTFKMWKNKLWGELDEHQQNAMTVVVTVLEQEKLMETPRFDIELVQKILRNLPQMVDDIKRTGEELRSRVANQAELNSLDSLLHEILKKCNNANKKARDLEREYALSLNRTSGPEIPALPKGTTQTARDPYQEQVEKHGKEITEMRTQMKNMEQGINAMTEAVRALTDLTQKQANKEKRAKGPEPPKATNNIGMDDYEWDYYDESNTYDEEEFSDQDRWFSSEDQRHHGRGFGGYGGHKNENQDHRNYMRHGEHQTNIERTNGYANINKERPRETREDSQAAPITTHTEPKRYDQPTRESQRTSEMHFPTPPPQADSQQRHTYLQEQAKTKPEDRDFSIEFATAKTKKTPTQLYKEEKGERKRRRDRERKKRRGIPISDPSSDPSSSDTTESESDPPPRRYGHGSRGMPNQSRGRKSKKPKEKRDPELFPPDSWYLTQFPPGWRVAPRKAKTGEKQLEVDKMLLKKNLERFDGNPERWFAWRERVKNTIHKAPWSVIWKLDCIEQMIDFDKCNSRDLLPGLEWNADTYLELITEMEVRFGGSEKLLDHHYKKVLELQQVRPGNVLDLHTYLTTIRAYMKVLIETGSGNDMESYSMFKQVFNKLPREYIIEYQKERKVTNPFTGGREYKKMNLTTLIQYVREKIDELNQLYTHKYYTLCPIEGRRSRAAKPNTQNSRSNQKAVGNKKETALFEDDVDPLEVLGSEDTPPELENTDTDEDDRFFQAQFQAGAMQNRGLPTCPICKTKHLLVRCEKYQQMTPQQRREVLKQYGHCYNCLRTDHGVTKCTLQRRCKECNSKHHISIHGSKEEPKKESNKINSRFTNNSRSKAEKTPVQRVNLMEDENEGTQDSEEDYKSDMSKVEHYNKMTTKSSPVSLRIIPVILHNKKTKTNHEFNALLDDGAQRNMLSERAKQTLGLTGYESTFKVGGVGGVVTEYQQSCFTNFIIESKDGQVKKGIAARVIPSPVGDLEPVDWNMHKQNWKHLCNIDFPEIEMTGVDLLIGGADAWLISSLEEVSGNKNEPVARRTRLGWTCLGYTTRPDLKMQKQSPDYQQIAIQNRYEEILSYIEYQESLINKGPDTNNLFIRDEVEFARRRAILDTELNDLVKKMWKMEELKDDNEKVQNKEEKYAIDKLRKSRKVLPDGRLEYETLWKKGEPVLPNNRPYAEMRLKNMESSKLLKIKEVREGFNEAIQGWLDKGYVRKVPKEEQRPKRAYYLPMFPVPDFNRATTKVRVVADAKCKYNNKSLNDAVLSGPNTINDLVEVLIRFRMRAVAIMGDVGEMFLQVSLAEEDRKYHRFLFRGSPEEPIEEYEFLVHSFGNAASPCIAIDAIKSEANLHKKEMPRAAETVLKSTLVDDNLDSVDTPDEAKNLAEDLQKLYAGIKMDIKKFASNSQEVMQAIPPEKRAKGFELMESGAISQAEVKALGLVWNTQEDLLTYQALEKLSPGHTKRQILKDTASLFDPLGHIIPFIIKARMLFQNACRDGKAWDEPISEDDVKDWSKWQAELKKIVEVKVPRTLLPHPVDNIKSLEIHIFADASSRAYAAIAYCRVESLSGDITTNLIMARGKLAPMTGQTIPRLELMAAGLAISVGRKVMSAMGLKKKQIFYWSDSKNVLCWIRSENKDLMGFIHNRLKPIHEHSLVENWRWVDTKNNPADVASRGASLSQLLPHPLWWEGPQFLQNKKDTWPKQDIEIELDAEGKKEVKKRSKTTPETAEAVLAAAEDYSRSKTNSRYEDFSTWTALRRRAAWVHKCFQHWRQWTKNHTNKRMTRSHKRHDQEKLIPKLDPENIQRGEEMIIREVQQEAFEEDLKHLQQYGHVQKRSHLIKLSPSIDQSGIVRLTGRLKQANHLNVDATKPILLPKGHHVTKLLIQCYHGNILKHVGGANHTLAEINRRFWIIAGRTFVKHVIQKCVHCTKRKNQPEHQVEAPLPESRLVNPESKLAPFTNTIVDAAGPFEIKRGKTRNSPTFKRYLMIFSCLTYRAVHIEVVHKLNTPCFLLAFERLQSRRGVPLLVRSDNAGSFRRGSQEIRELREELDEEQLLNKYPEIKWQFSPPRSPHTQGAIERLVQSTKRGLKAVINGEVLDDETFHTFAVKVEGILNKRPITYVSTELEDPQALCPNDFLTPLTTREMAPIPTDRSDTMTKRWVLVQEMLDHFWNRFVTEYIPQLNPLNKWYKKKEPVRVGDVCCLLEKNARGKWPLALITKVYPTQDGQARTVQIKVIRDPNENTETPCFLDRHICKLMVLVREQSPARE